MSTRIFTEDDQVDLIEGGWSLDGIADDFFQVAVVGSGLRLILGVPDRSRGGPVEILVMTAEGDQALAALAAVMPALRHAICQHGEIGNGVCPHRNRERISASPEDLAQAIRMIADMPTHQERPAAG